MAKKKPAPPERLIPFLTQKQIKQLVKIVEARTKKEPAIQRAMQRATGRLRGLWTDAELDVTFDKSLL